MLDYRDIVDYVLLVFRKKSLEPISEEESLEIAQIVEKAQSGGKVSAQAVSGKKNTVFITLTNPTTITTINTTFQIFLTKIHFIR